MNPGGNRFLGRIMEHYDKVMAFVVLLALVSSLLLLVVKIGEMRQIEADFEGWMRGLRPVNEHARAVDPAPYEAAKSGFRTPLLLALPGEANPGLLRMFVPETRFNCRECRHPVSVLAEVCPFCQTPVVLPEPETVDHDGDGMPTWWERKFGLDPFDPSDAQKDFDDDGYSNSEEQLAETDPTRQDSRPVAVGRLVLEKISGTQFGLRFNSLVRTGSGFRFGLNYRLPDGQTKTDFVDIGDSVAGFKVEGYKEKLQRAQPPKMGVEDLSELTLRTSKGDAITLVKDRAVQYVELMARLTLDLRGTVERRDVRKGEDFTVDGRIYTVIDIDARARHVVVSDKETRSERTIRQADGGGGSGE
jgi:hypothetical protein